MYRCKRVKENMTEELQHCFEAPFYTPRPARYRHRPRLRPHHLGHRRDNIGWYGTAMLCCVTPKEHPGLPDKEDVRTGIITYKLAHAADLAKVMAGAQLRDNALAKRVSSSAGGDQFRLSSTRTPESFHDETLPAEGAKIAHFAQCAVPNSAR